MNRYNSRLNLFADISKIIFSIVNDYYNVAAKIAIKSAAVVSHQTYGDILRHNPHWHCIILEGGIDENNSFHYLPITDTSKLTEVFRRRVIKYFVYNGLLESSFARNLLSWKYSGFSVDSILIPAKNQKARTGLSQYIARPKVL